MKTTGDGMRVVKSATGFGLIEVLIAIVVFSVAMTSIAFLNTWLGKQATQIADLSQLNTFRSNILTFVMDNPSWLLTATKQVGAAYVNPGMVTCLTGGGGSSAGCVQYRANLFDLYDASGGLVYKSRGVNTNGVTVTGIPCGPDSSAGAPYTTYVYPSPNCPLQYKLYWVQMDLNPYTNVGVIATLEVGRLAGGAPATDLTINPARFSFMPPGTSAPQFYDGRPLAINPNPNWPSTLIYRNALP